MKEVKETIKHLNKILRNELTAINQYFLHSRMFGHMGYKKLEAKEYEESIDEMKHADEIVKRILFLEGIPNLQDIGKIRIGENPQEMLECDLAIENIAIPDLREAIAFMEGIKDFASADLLHRILESEEQHVDWLSTQLRLIKELGVSGYLQTQI